MSALCACPFPGACTTVCTIRCLHYNYGPFLVSALATWPSLVSALATWPSLVSALATWPSLVSALHSPSQEYRYGLLWCLHLRYRWPSLVSALHGPSQEYRYSLLWCLHYMVLLRYRYGLLWCLHYMVFSGIDMGLLWCLDALHGPWSFSGVFTSPSVWMIHVAVALVCLELLLKSSSGARLKLLLKSPD